MEIKEHKDWKIDKKKNQIVECIAIGCTKEPNGCGLCWDHQAEQNKELRYS